MIMSPKPSATRCQWVPHWPAVQLPGHSCQQAVTVYTVINWMIGADNDDAVMIQLKKPDAIAIYIYVALEVSIYIWPWKSQ